MRAVSKRGSARPPEAGRVLVQSDGTGMTAEVADAARRHRVPTLAPPGLPHDLPAEPPGPDPPALPEAARDYYARIEALQFAVQHDNGQRPADLPKADLVLVAVSRTSKTPLSIYQAGRGWKVANVPLVLGFDPPAELFGLKGRTLGLT